MGTEPGTPTFDQLRVLLAVVDAKTLAGAARRLGRATSAVSYAIAQLESQLGIALFDRQTTRRLQLTQAGQAVMAEACVVAGAMDALRAKVKGLLDGLEAEVSVVVDVMYPTARLVQALRAFQQHYPTVGIRLHVEALGAVTQKVLEGGASFGISGPLRSPAAQLVYQPMAALPMVPVAAPDHPLIGAVTAGAARDHIQLVLTDRSRLTEGQDFAVLSVKTWRLADLGAKHALLLAGVGWGQMPEHMVRDDLRTGRLVVLKLPEWEGGMFPLHVVHLASTPPGPAARWLIGRLSL
jgi:DNA-binding transcriptional LysR family regulator